MTVLGRGRRQTVNDVGKRSKRGRLMGGGKKEELD